MPFRTERMVWRDCAEGAEVLNRGDELVGRDASADIGAEQREVRAFGEADLELDTAIDRRNVEGEDAGARAFAER